MAATRPGGNSVNDVRSIILHLQSAAGRALSILDEDRDNYLLDMRMFCQALYNRLMNSSITLDGAEDAVDGDVLYSLQGLEALTGGAAKEPLVEVVREGFLARIKSYWAVFGGNGAERESRAGWEYLAGEPLNLERADLTGNPIDGTGTSTIEI